MSENKIHVRLNSEELFDQLLQESKNNLESSKKKIIAELTKNGDNLQDKIPPESEVSCQNKTADSNEGALIPIKEINNLSEKISTFPKNTEFSQSEQMDSLKEKVFNPSKEMEKFDQSGERTMTKSPLLGKDDYYKIKKDFQNDRASTEIADCLREYVFSSTAQNSEECNNLNQELSLVRSYSISDVQSLDNAVENVVVSESNQSIASGSQDIISKAYFQEDSNFSLKISPVFSPKSNIAMDKPSIKRASNQLSKEINAHNGEKTASNILFDQKAVTNKLLRIENSEENYSFIKNVEDDPIELDKLTPISNKPGFSSPKSKYPDIYLHKDKINILRQMSHIFNAENFDCNIENNVMCNKDILDKPLDQENANYDSVEIDHLTNNSKVSNETNFVQNKTDALIDITENEMVKSKILANAKSENLIMPAEILDESNKNNLLPEVGNTVKIQSEENCAFIGPKISVPVHLVSSTASKYEKEIKVETFIGKCGEDIDVIDGFAFVSFDSVEKLNNYKGKGKLKPKVLERNLRRKMKKKKRFLLSKKILKKEYHKTTNKEEEATSTKSKYIADTSKEACLDGDHIQAYEKAQKTGTIMKEFFNNMCGREKNAQLEKTETPAIKSPNASMIKEHCKDDISLRKGDSNMDHSIVSGKENSSILKENSVGIKLPKKIQLKRKYLKKRLHKISTKFPLKRNEILYLYSGGDLITLGGSICKISTTNNGPLRGRVVLPNDMDYMDLRKKEALREVRPIEINKDLAAFALSALQSPELNKILNGETVKSEKNSSTNIDISRKSLIPIMESHNDKSKGEKENNADNNKENKNEFSTSKVKWTQADVIKSTVGSSNNKKPTAPQKNINRFPSLSREMKRLNMHFISCDNAIQEETTYSNDDEDTCSNETYCKLGCICASLKCRKLAASHCGRISCMFDCNCKIDNLGEKGINISIARSVSILNLDKEHQHGLATEEKEFKKTIVQSGSDVFLLGERKKRDIKLPERYRDTDDFCLKISELSALKMKAEPVKNSVAVSYVSPEDYSKYTKKFQIEMPWYKIPNTVSVWCMFHKCYDCKCLYDPKYAHKHEMDMEYLTSSSNDELSDDEYNVRETVNIDTQSSAIICQKLVKIGHSLQQNNTYVFKYWIHNGEHHTARSCGYEMKNMRFEHIEKMPYHYPEPSKPLVMGMTAKNCNYLPPSIRKSPNLSPGRRHSPEKIKPNDLTSFQSSANGRINGNIPHAGNQSTVTMENLNDHSSSSSDLDSNSDGSRISLHWMIKEEEKRGELDLDLSGNTPGRTIIVSEPRFKKLLNMCIIGIVGLSNSHRCIISAVKSSEDLVKMQKIHHLIMNNTVDVGPHMKEIFFTQSGNKCRYVMIRCDTVGRWEIFGVVQKKDEDECSSISKKNSPSKSFAVRSNESNRTPIINTSETSQGLLKNSSEATHTPHINSLDASRSSFANNSENFQSEMYVNEFGNKEDGLPLITDVVSASDKKPSYFTPRDEDSSIETISASETDEQLSNSLSQKSNSDSVCTIQRVASNITVLQKGTHQAVNLATLAPSKSHFPVKSLSTGLGNLDTHAIIRPDYSTDHNYIALSANQNIVKKSLVLPQKAVPLSIFSKNILETSSSIPISVASPNTSLNELASYTCLGSLISPMKRKHSQSSISPVRKRSNPLILRKSNNPTKNISGQKSTNNKNPASSIIADTSEYIENNSPRLISTCNSGLSNVEIGKGSLSLDSQPAEQHINEGESLSGNKSDPCHSNIVFESSPQSIDTAKHYNNDTAKVEKMPSSDDLTLRLESSSDSINDLYTHDESENVATSTYTDITQNETMSSGCVSLLNLHPTTTELRTPETEKVSPRQVQSPELVFVSSQKLEELSSIDMSINFHSIKVHWLSGTIGKVVLSTILQQSGLRRVPISLVVESLGKMVKFFGQKYYGKSNFPILVLGTDLEKVKQNSISDYSHCLKNNPVKYLIKVAKHQMCTFTHDKTGLNLVRIKNFTHGKSFPNCPSRVKVPIDVLREPINYKIFNYFGENAGREVSKPSVVKGSLNAAVMGKTSVVPVVIHLDKANSRGYVWEFAQHHGKKKQTPFQLFKRRKTGSGFTNKVEPNLKKTKLSSDAATSAHLGGTSKSNSISLQREHCKTTPVVKESTMDQLNILPTCTNETAQNLCGINPSSLLNISNNKAFGIACYEENQSQIIDLSEDDKRKVKLKPKAAKMSKASGSAVKHTRKQSFKRIREIDTGSESFDDSTSSSSGLVLPMEGMTSPKMKLPQRMHRVAEEHNLREKFRRKVESGLFLYLRNVIFENGVPIDRETGSKISRGNILSDAFIVIRNEEVLSSNLAKEETTLRTQREMNINKLEKFLPALPESKKNELTQLLLKTDLDSPSAKEDVIHKFQPKSFSIGENIKIKEDGQVLYHGLIEHFEE